MLTQTQSPVTDYDTTAYNTTAYDTTAYDTAAYDAAAYDTAAHDAAAHDAAAHDIAAQDAAAQKEAAQAVERLIERHLPLVGHIVRETMARLPSHINRDDLVSAGMTALVLTARGFDASRGVPFARFAAIRIRGALVDELRSMDWASRSVRSMAREVEGVRGSLANKLDRLPRADEVAAALGVTPSQLSSHDADVHRASVLSIQGFTADSGPAMLPDSQRGPEQILLDREQLGYLHDAVEALPERLAYIVRCYFFEQRQMSDLAVELGVTESRISQLRAEALKLLRHGMSAQYNDDTHTPTGRSQAKLAAYAASVAARGDLRSRLEASDSHGEAIKKYLVA